MNLAQSVLVQGDGKIIVVGSDNGRLVVARYRDDGSRDTTFGGGDGLASTTLSARGAPLNFDEYLGATLQPDGKLLVTTEGSFNLSRFTGPCISDVVLASNLEVTVTGESAAVAGGNVSYTVAVTNIGSVASGVVLTDELPANTTFVSFVAPAGWTTTTPAVGNTGTVTAAIPSVARDATASFTLIVHVNAHTSNGATLVNTAIAATAAPDSNPDNNSDTESTTVQTRADLSVAMHDSPGEQVAVGANLTYTIDFTNRGLSDAQDVTIIDPVPNNTTFVSATVSSGAGWTAATPAVGSIGNVTFAKATVAAGETAVFTIVVKVNANTLSSTTINNSATVASSTLDPNLADNIDAATTTVTDVNSVIWGYVYLDVNNDGLKGTPELALPNVPVTLSGPVTMTVLTDADGRYEFTDLLPGTYSIEARQPSAFIDGRETPGTAGVGEVGLDRFDAIPLQHGQQLGNYNFGERGLRAELITKRLYLASTPSSTVLVEGLTNSGENWFFLRAARSAVLTASFADGEKPLEMYTESMMPVSLGMNSSPLATEVMAGAGYYVYAAGVRGQELILELGPDLDARGPNPKNPLDASDDGVVSPLDALLVINALNRRGAGESTRKSREYYLDTNGDGSLSPLDALLIINRLNSPGGQAEGESASASEGVQEQVESSWRAVSGEDVKTSRDVLWIVSAYDNYLRNTRRHRHFPVTEHDWWLDAGQTW
jgi:uncharacterized repeat protein (TIGR01451 family)